MTERKPLVLGTLEAAPTYDCPLVNTGHPIPKNLSQPQMTSSQRECPCIRASQANCATGHHDHRLTPATVSRSASVNHLT